MGKASKRKLNKMQQRFILEYLVDFNATKAAQRAGYSEKTAYAQGHELLKHPEIRDAINKGALEQDEIIHANKKYVLDKSKGVIEADLVEWADLGKKGVEKSQLEKMPKELRIMVTAIDRVDYYNRYGEVSHSRYKFKLMDKTKVLEIIGKHTGAIKENVEHSGEVKIKTFNDLVRSSKAKKDESS
ncbi:MAG: terminase small subunit [Thermodesulfobacteriota bacterium]